MQRTFKILVTLAVTTVSLAVVSSASAMLPADVGGSAPQTTPSGGFDWYGVSIGVAVAVAAVAACVGVVRHTRTRGRLAPSH
jgi:hypothetical protein